MRRIVFITGILALAFALNACNTNQNRGRGGMMGGRGMGGGMMQRSGGNGQSGMMGNRGGQTGRSKNQYGQQNYGQQSAQPLTPERARSMAQQYLESTGNTGYVLGKETETNSEYEFPLLMRSDSSRVASLMVNKQTGAVSSRQ